VCCACALWCKEFCWVNAQQCKNSHEQACKVCSPLKDKETVCNSYSNFHSSEETNERDRVRFVNPYLRRGRNCIRFCFKLIEVFLWLCIAVFWVHLFERGYLWKGLGQTKQNIVSVVVIVFVFAILHLKYPTMAANIYATIILFFINAAYNIYH